MKRFWFGIGLLTALLVLGAVTVRKTATAHGEAAQLLQTAAQADPHDAAALARQAKSLWEASRLYTAVTADHDAMEEVDALFAQLEAAREDPAQLRSLCAELAVRIGAIGDSQSLTLENIL